MNCSSFIVFKQLLGQQKSITLHVFLGAFDGSAKRGVIADVDRLAQREVFVVRNENDHGAAVSLEDGVAAGQLALTDELTHVRRQVEQVESLFHRRRGFADTRGTRRQGRDASARSRRSPSGSRASLQRRNASLTRRILRSRLVEPALASHPSTESH